VGCGCVGGAAASLIGGGWLGVAGSGSVLKQALLCLVRGVSSAEEAGIEGRGFVGTLRNPALLARKTIRGGNGLGGVEALWVRVCSFCLQSRGARVLEVLELLAGGRGCLDSPV